MCLSNIFGGCDCTWILFIIILLLLAEDNGGFSGGVRCHSIARRSWCRGGRCFSVFQPDIPGQRILSMRKENGGAGSGNASPPTLPLWWIHRLTKAI